ncbi:OprO/OprP family phosphate-selective porin [Vulgatibacter incomptus]|uniref:Phosphate-specific outer membrane porin OprP n=1 Tax=Vulgatibacter incomptus TaxID=1391653 RepID=A0A0K1PCN1_9BACT|nr:porin [Vulgatibacter incomptus]AKU91257.1 Phosphate-specific outer membrane porin OprP [Vulgatibacter incomptus]
MALERKKVPIDAPSAASARTARRRCLDGLLIAALLAFAAFPASGAAKEKEDSAATPPEIRIDSEGFSLRSQDGDFVLHLDGYIQADARIYAGKNDSSLPDTFALRRVRPILAGTLYRYLNFRLMPDFGLGVAIIQDAWVEILPLKGIGFRMGKYKAPVGLERLQTATDLFFAERAFPTLLVPNRDVGAELHGDFFHDAFSWAIGAFNGAADNASLDLDPDHGKEVAGRIFIRPIPKGFFRFLGLGYATTYGKAKGTAATPELATFVSAGQHTFFKYRTGTEAAFIDGKRYRFAPQLYFFTGGFGLLGEYYISTEDVRVGDDTRRLTNKAWQAAGTYVIGGRRRYDGVKPRHSISQGGAGAFEFAARYSELHIDPRTFPTFNDPSHAQRIAREWAVNFGWWPSPSARFMVSFFRTRFVSGVESVPDEVPENAFIVRSQIAW